MRNNKDNKFVKQRRNLLKTIAAAGITPGLLNASGLVSGMMIARATEASTGTANKSLLILGCGGSIDEKWRPRSDFSLPVMSAPYEDVKQEMNFIAGGKMTGGGHGIPWHRFNDGSWSQDSFDVNLGRTIGENHRLKYLNLGVYADNSLSRQGGSFVPTINDPETALSQIFAGGISSGTSTSGKDPRLAIVDMHKEAMHALKTKLGHHEKIKLDNHLTAIEEFEKKFSNSDNSSAATCGAPPSTHHEGSFDRLAEIQTEIAILALKCNVTPSVSLAFGNDGHTFVMRNGRIAHASHHDGDSSEYEKDCAYMSNTIARVLRRMREEGLLDSTVVTKVADMGDARSHSNRNVPLFMAGAGIKGGQVTQVSSSTTQGDLYKTVARLLGADQHPNYRNFGSSGVDQVLI